MSKSKTRNKLKQLNKKHQLSLLQQIKLLTDNKINNKQSFKSQINTRNNTKKKFSKGQFVSIQCADTHVCKKQLDGRMGNVIDDYTEHAQYITVKLLTPCSMCKQGPCDEKTLSVTNILDQSQK